MPIGLSGVQLGSAQNIARSSHISNDKSWDSLVKGLDKHISRIGAEHPKQGLNSVGKIEHGQLVDLLKLQVDLHRCQVKVELLSKVSESATAAFRKLEQGQ